MTTNLCNGLEEKHCRAEYYRKNTPTQRTRDGALLRKNLYKKNIYAAHSVMSTCYTEPY